MITLRTSSWRRSLVGRAAMILASLALVGATTSPATAATPTDQDADATAPTTKSVSIVGGEVGEEASWTITKDFSGSGSPIVELPANPAELVPDQEATASSSSCFWAKPSYDVYNHLGKISESWYYIEWCGSGGEVTSVLTLYCGGTGHGAFEYLGCSVNHGSVGFSSVKILGDWTYRAGCCGAYNYHYVEVDANHYHDGTYSGTWSANT